MSTVDRGVGAPEEILVPVDVPVIGDERRKNWAKVVHSVDEQKDTGWAFEGEFVSVGGIQDVPAGAVLLVYGEKGSRGNPQSLAAVYVVNSDATISQHGTASGRAWARTLRDTVVELIDGPISAPSRLEWRPELMLYRDDAIVQEMQRRGLLDEGVGD